MLFAVVLLAACGGNSLDAFELLELSQEAQAEADISGMTLELDALIEVDMTGMEMTLPFSILLEMESEERMHMDMNVTIPMAGEESMTMFIRDGYVYTDEDGRQTRTAMDTSDDVDMTEFIELFEDLFGDDFDWEDFTASASAESTDDGYRLAFTYEIEDLIRLIAEVMSDMPGADIDGLIDEMTEDLGEGEWDIAMVMYLDEDYMLVSVEYTIVAEVSIEEMGETMEMTMDLTLSLTIGDVTIDFPAWLDEAQFDVAEISFCTVDLFGEEMTLIPHIEGGYVTSIDAEMRVNFNELGLDEAEAEELAELDGGRVEGDYIIFTETEYDRIPLDEFIEEAESFGAVCN